jgi:cyclomaltodextrinase / maltogenic alpha-amylase / neopullulanase
MRYTIVVILALSMAGCSWFKEGKNPVSEEIHGNAAVSDLISGENIIDLADIFINPMNIDSLEVTGVSDFEWDPSLHLVSFTTHARTPAMIEMRCWVDNMTWTVLFRKSRKMDLRLEVDMKETVCSSLQLAGSMNDWNPSQSSFTKYGDRWFILLNLNPGKYHYQLVADGNWIPDPGNPIMEDNNIGGFNSVLMAGEQNSDSLPELSTLKYTENEIVISIKNKVSKWVVLWENHKLGKNKLRQEEDRVYITIPKNAKKKDRSYIRVFAWNDFGVGNDLLIPLSEGKVLKAPDQLSKNDKHRQILYFLMVDRFRNGDPTNDPKLEDPELHEKAGYYGGDFSTSWVSILFGFLR